MANLNNPTATREFVNELLDGAAQRGDPIDAADNLIRAIQLWVRDHALTFGEETDDLDHEDFEEAFVAWAYNGKLDQDEIPDLGAITDELNAKLSGYVD
jgi:hypothetical protein